MARAAVMLLLASQAAPAAQLTASARSVEWAGIVAHDVTVTILPAGRSSGRASVHAAAVDGLAAAGRLEQLRVDCARLAARANAVRCDGRLGGHLGRAGRQDTPVSFELRALDRAWLRADRLALAGGTAGAEATLAGAAWTVDARFTDVQLDAAARLLRASLPDGSAVTGSAAGSVRARGGAGGVRGATFELELQDTGFANAAGTLAAEGIGVSIAGRLEAAGRAAWTLEGRLASTAGQAYVEPWFVDFGQHPLAAEARGRFAAGPARLELADLQLTQRDVGRVAGSVDLDLAGGPLLAALDLRLEEIELATALPLFVQPPLVGTAFRDVTGAGRVRGVLAAKAGLPTRIGLELEGVDLGSAAGGLSVQGLEGHFSWFDDASRNALAPGVDSAVFKSLLGWRGARLWGLEIGAAELPFTTTGRHFRLLEPVFVPVFDGGVAIETIRIRHAGTRQMYLRFDAEVRPISVARISTALGWPEFSGSVAGRIPRLELADGYLTLGGNLEATVFDGTVTVRDLRLRDPLGQFPQLSASIDVDRLDLAYVTNTFEFGLITGRLSGRIDGLELFDWVPVRFDAGFHSTPGDRSPRRISQRAVANLSSIGGGSGGTVSAALQGGFMRFFKTFRYRELGLSCRLANDVCFMDGVAPAKGGYYIVRGAGLPRVDVIGNQRRVAWTRLVQQLAAMTQGGELVIE